MKYHFHKEVSIQINSINLKGELVIPKEGNAVVVFSHGSGSSRFSKRNKMVAEYLNKKDLGTLLFDLLTEEEDKTFSNRFNIELLSKRLTGVVEWMENFPATIGSRIGFFGASTGGASALQAAAELPQIGAVVSRGGRPDLAKNLTKVNAPTLLIVGSLDQDVLEMNRQAFELLTCEKKLEVVPGASHLFEEQGKMEIVSELAGKWFEKYLSFEL